MTREKNNNKKKFIFSRRSLARLGGVKPDLVKVAHRALKITEIDFAVIDGLRSVTRQKALMEAGKTPTMNSRHLTGHAIDLAAYVNGEISWEWNYYEKIADAMLKAGAEYGINIVWGGLWKSRDGVHFELHRGQYS